MSFSDLFDSEFKERNKGHFSSMVRVALSDGSISEQEKKFLDRLANNLDISAPEYEEILENPLKYPINPPYLYTRRIERLYDLVRMVHVDTHLGDKQLQLLRRFTLSLGFTSSNVAYIVDKAMNLIEHDVDLDTFMYEIQNMNK